MGRFDEPLGVADGVEQPHALHHSVLYPPLLLSMDQTIGAWVAF